MCFQGWYQLLLIKERDKQFFGTDMYTFAVKTKISVSQSRIASKGMQLTRINSSIVLYEYLDVVLLCTSTPLNVFDQFSFW